MFSSLDEARRAGIEVVHLYPAQAPDAAGCVDAGWTTGSSQPILRRLRCRPSP